MKPKIKSQTARTHSSPPYRGRGILLFIVEKNGRRAPKIKCVICGLSNAAYRRPDGVFVVPLTALKM